MLSCMAGMLAGMFAVFVRDPRRRRQGHAAAAWVDLPVGLPPVLPDGADRNEASVTGKKAVSDGSRGE